MWWGKRCTGLIYASQSRVRPARRQAGEISHHRWVFINQSLSFSLPELLHSPTQLTELPIKSVGACQHEVLPLMQTHAHSRVLCLHRVCLYTTSVFECQFKEMLIWIWQVKQRLHQLNTQIEVEHNDLHIWFPVCFLSLFLKALCNFCFEQRNLHFLYDVRLYYVSTHVVSYFFCALY